MKNTIVFNYFNSIFRNNLAQSFFPFLRKSNQHVTFTIYFFNLVLFFFWCVYIEFVKVGTMYVINNRNFAPRRHINKWHLSIK